MRRKVFWALAAAIATVPVERGASLASKNLDQEPPTLSLNPIASPTRDEKITISGVTVGATRVLVVGKPAQFDRKARW